jgi:hypothetical protein
VETDPLPNAAHAVVGRGKVVDYLLSATHPEGRSKARFFSSHGAHRPSGSAWLPHSSRMPQRMA